MLSCRVQSSLPPSGLRCIQAASYMGILIAYLLGILTATKSEYHNRSNNQQAANSRESKTPLDSPLSVICLPPTLTDEEAAEKKKNKGRKTVKFWTQIATLIVLCVYTGLTLLIWCTTGKQLSAYEDAESALVNVDFSIEKVNDKWVRHLSIANLGQTATNSITIDEKGDFNIPNKKWNPAGDKFQYAEPNWQEIEAAMATHTGTDLIVYGLKREESKEFPDQEISLTPSEVSGEESYARVITGGAVGRLWQFVFWNFFSDRP